MNLLLLLALAVPLSCLACLSLFALLGVMTLGAVIHVLVTVRTRWPQWRCVEQANNAAGYLSAPTVSKETPASAAPVALRIVASASYAGLRIIPHKNSRCTDGPYVGWFTRDSRHCSARPAPSGRRFLTLGSFFEPDLLKK
jgi:hypothetical protein